MQSAAGQAGLVAGGALASTLIIKYAGEGLKLYFSKDNTGKNFNEILLGAIVGGGALFAYSQKKSGSTVNEGHLILLGMIGGATSQLIKSAISKVSGPPLLEWQDPQMLNGAQRPKATIIY